MQFISIMLMLLESYINCPFRVCLKNKGIYKWSYIHSGIENMCLCLFLFHSDWSGYVNQLSNYQTTGFKNEPYPCLLLIGRVTTNQHPDTYDCPDPPCRQD